VEGEGVYEEYMSLTVSPMEAAILCLPVESVSHAVKVLLKKGAVWPQPVVEAVRNARTNPSAGAPLSRFHGLLSERLVKQPGLLLALQELRLQFGGRERE